MFCSGCGLALAQDQAFCPQCGRPISAPIPPVPGMQFQLDAYAGKVRALAVCWYVYAGLSLLMGIAALTFARVFLSHGLGHWLGGEDTPTWLLPAIVHLGWSIMVVRSALAVAAGWGLMERSQWGRIVAIIAAILNFIKFPFGTALGIATLVVLLGYRNSTLYDQL